MRISFFAIFISLCILSLNICTGNSKITQYEKWYDQGTLHKANTLEWKNSTFANKRATAADWLASTIWKGNLNSLNDFENLKISSEKLVHAIDSVVETYTIENVEGVDTMSIAELAAFLILYSNDLGP